MARLQHTVTVVALDRARLHAFAGVFCDLIESTRSRGRDIVLEDGRTVPDIRLTEGHHLRPGARYEPVAGDTEEQESTVIRAWRRTEVLAVEQRVRSADFEVRTGLRVRSPERPRSLEAELRMRGPEGSGVLRRFSGRAALDLPGWWAAAAAAPGTPEATRAPATARVKHWLGDARLRLRPRPAGPDQWSVEVTLVLRGRWLLRPVAAVALLLATVPLRRGFRSSVEQAATQWNETVGRLLAHDLEDIRAELTDSLVRGPDAPDSRAPGSVPPAGTGDAAPAETAD